MGVIVNKENNTNNELSRRIDADLKAKLSGNSREESADADFVDDAEYLENSKKTGRFAWVWIVLVLLAVASLVYMAFI